MYSFAAMERLLFPGFLLFFEIIFLVLYGFLVEYDNSGLPEHDLSEARKSAEAGDSGSLIRNLESSLATTKTYPCKITVAAVFLAWLSFIRLWQNQKLLEDLLVLSAVSSYLHGLQCRSPWILFLSVHALFSKMHAFAF